MGTVTALGATTAETCLTGTLKYTFADAEAGAGLSSTKPVRNANWELRGKVSSSSAEQTFSTGLTSYQDGSFRACASYATLSSAYVRFSSSSTSSWRVISDYRNVRSQHTFTAGFGAATGTKNLGTVNAPANQAGAWKIIDTVNKLYWKSGSNGCFTTRQCDQLTFVWPYGPGGNFFDTNGETYFVFMEQSGPASQHTILHEAGHWYQYQLNGRFMPPITNCNPHDVDVKSSKSCAWTEGFADAVAAWILGDRRYVYPNGNFKYFDRAPAGYAGGDETQGNVAGSLLDLFAFDGPNGTWGNNIEAMKQYRALTFHDYYFINRPRAGLPTTGQPKTYLNNHGIYY
jgi:hypothetical protein